MKNALILHGTDFQKDKKQSSANWFPWLKNKLENLGYETWLPELPEAWHPDLDRYWHYLKNWDYNRESIIIGHSSGGATVFGLLHKLPQKKKIKLAVSVAGFYQDDGWGCKGLFSEPYNWKKIKNQAEKIKIIYSPDDPYIKEYQTNGIAQKLKMKPTVFPNSKHFNLEAGERFRTFPELLSLIIQFIE